MFTVDHKAVCKPLCKAAPEADRGWLMVEEQPNSRKLCLSKHQSHYEQLKERVLIDTREKEM